MKQSVVAGIVLGVLVALWVLILGFTGLYKHPVGALAFLLVIPINIGVVVWGLRRTRKEGRGYGGQIGAALIMGVVASIVIFFNSLLFTQVLFPNYFDEINSMQMDLLRAQGVPEAEIQTRVEHARAGQSATKNALGGVVGTMGTTLVTALIAAAFIRKKD